MSRQLPGAASPFRNFRALLVLHGSTYALALLVVPYLLHLFGPARYGHLIMAQTLAGAFLILVDYGLSFSATQAFSQCREDPEASGRLLATVLGTKSSLVLVCFPVYLAIVWVMRLPLGLYLLTYGSVLGSALFPNWAFQGLERMAIITRLQIVSQLMVLLLLVAFVHSSSDLLRVAAIQGLFPVLSGLTGLYLFYRIHPLVLQRPRWTEMRRLLQAGFPVLLGTLSAFLFCSGNIWLTGAVAGAAAAGLYGTAWKLLTPFSGLIGHVQTAVYPRLSRLRKQASASQLRRFLRLYAIISIGGAALVSLFLALLAPRILWIIGGRDYLEAVPVFRVLVMTLPLIALNTVLTGSVLLNNGRRWTFGIVLLLTAIFDVPAVLSGLHWAGSQGAAVGYAAAEAFELLVFLSFWVFHARGNLSISAIPETS